MAARRAERGLSCAGGRCGGRKERSKRREGRTVGLGLAGGGGRAGGRPRQRAVSESKMAATGGWAAPRRCAARAPDAAPRHAAPQPRHAARGRPERRRHLSPHPSTPQPCSAGALPFCVSVLFFSRAFPGKGCCTVSKENDGRASRPRFTRPSVELSFYLRRQQAFFSYSTKSM